MPALARPSYGNAGDQAYQIRVAGELERLMTAPNGDTVWADGAIIDAKNPEVISYW